MLGSVRSRRVRVGVLGGVALLGGMAGAEAPRSFAGFDRNEYPGDEALAGLRKQFAFTGYWLNNPPGASANTWAGHRGRLVEAGFGFLVLYNGRLDGAIKGAGVAPGELAKQDAAEAVVSARKEGFPRGTILFLDQEEGGRLLPEQAAYLFGWTEAVAASGFRPGAYVSGQPAPDGGGATITTAEDVRQKTAAGHLHEVALWVAQDACPPAPGCVVRPLAVAESGTSESDTVAWQYAQSPRRGKVTQACAQTYAADNNCYPAGESRIFVDLDTATSADPSHGR